MMEFRAYCESIKSKYKIKSENYLNDLNTYLIDNNWFGIKPVWENDKMLVNPHAFEPYIPNIIEYFEKSGLGESERKEEIKKKLHHLLPDTAAKLERFYKKFPTPDHIQIQVSAFIMKYVKIEVSLLTDFKLTTIMNTLCEEESKQVGDSFSTFLAWVKKHNKVNYYKDYAMEKRYIRDNNAAYDIDDYLHLIYYLYNPKYIDEEKMYQKASASKNYTDTWLYLALHLICALRDTDIVRIYHPVLKHTPKEILSMIAQKIFPETEAREVLYSITRQLNFLPLRPNKVKKNRDVTDIKFHVPESAEVHLGTLFALAEAHRLLAGVKDDAPLIRCIKTYDDIKRNMGEEIGSLFLYDNFRTLSANKSYLQSIFSMADDILGYEDDFKIRGYMIAALARSHKSSYGDFAKTTFTYLKDAKLNGMTPEFVARELFERGVLSCIPSMLLKTLYGHEYNNLSIANQTKLIQKLNLSPREVETAIAVSHRNLKRSTELVNELYTTMDKQTILNALHRIGYGGAVSKQDGCYCLLTAFGELCPFDEIQNCICCDYELSTKATLFQILNEYKRQMSIFYSTNSILEKKKSEDITKTVILPALDQMLNVISEVYGSETLQIFETIIKESLNDV